VTIDRSSFRGEGTCAGNLSRVALSFSARGWARAAHVILVPFALAGAVGSCRAAETRPVVPPAPEWRASVPQPAAPQTDSAPALPVPNSVAIGTGAWTLERLVNRALDSNRSVLTSRDGVVAAGYSLIAAESAFQLMIFPRSSLGSTEINGAGAETLGLGVEFTKRFMTGTQVSVRPNVQLLGDEYTSGITTAIRQPLFRGTDPEAVRAGIDFAEFSARSARRSLYRTQVETVQSTITAAYQVVRQREFLRLSEESVERLTGHAEAARARERAGVASSIDVFRATLQLNQAQDGLIVARDAYGDALDSLRILLALPITAPLDVELPLTFDAIAGSEAEAIQCALDERVELEQARDSILEFERRSRVARDGTKPDVGLALSYQQFGNSDGFGNSLDLTNDALTVSLTTSSDLARRAEFAFYEQTLLNVNATRRSFELQRDQVVREVRLARRDLTRAAQRIELQEDQIRQAQGQLELARVKFSRGLASNFDIIDAESALRRGQTNLISAVIDYILGTYRLKAATGTLLEREGGRV